MFANLLATLQSDKPAFGVATNGDEFVLKLVTGEAPLYNVSRTFSLFGRRREEQRSIANYKAVGTSYFDKRIISVVIE